MITLKKLYDDLDYWAMINIDSDIYNQRNTRVEYLPFVQKAESFGFKDELITKFVLLTLKDEIEKPWYKKNLKLIIYIAKINIRYFFLNFHKKLIQIKIRLKH